MDPKIGGGRLIGEAVHYISLAQFIFGSAVSSYSINAIDSSLQVPDSFILNLSLANGDIASITYYSIGSKRYKKSISGALVEEKLQ